MRAFQPSAAEAQVLLRGHSDPLPMRKLPNANLFEIDLPLISETAPAPSSYVLRFRTEHGEGIENHDPYAFPYLLSEFDLYLMGEGRHYDTYEKLGAHLRTVDGVTGVHFAVWAPSARRVSVVGDFNRWDGRVHPMRARGSSGIWELFLPDQGEGAIYKYEILDPQGTLLPLKSDPYGFAAELRPKTGSVVARLDKYEWKDSEWVEQRAHKRWLEQPITVYEVHLGSWRRIPEEHNRWLSYHELAEQLIPYVKELGYTHIELLPVMEHPYDASWGYQTLGYYAVTSRYGSPTDFMEFVDRCHQAGLGVILDWTPAHFPRDAHGLAFFDGTHLYEHSDPRQGSHPDWGTLVYNYGRNEVQNYLISNALFWLDKYHIDGLRVDAVASMLYLDYSRKHHEWVPNRYGGRENLEAIDFFKRLNEVAHLRFPGVLTVAEESTSWPSVSRPTYLGGLGFSLKWNMGWMNDTLRYFSKDPIFRRYEHNKLTFSLLYAFSENFMLPFSHDEVVHGKNSLLHKMPGDLWQQFANLRLLLAYQYAHPGKKLLFMGQEFLAGGWFDDDKILDWSNAWRFSGITQLYRDLIHLRRNWFNTTRGLQSQNVNVFHVNDTSKLLGMHRWDAGGPGDDVVVVLNFANEAYSSYQLGFPRGGTWRVRFNSDANVYDAYFGNWPTFDTEAGGVGMHGMQASASVSIGPYSAVILSQD